jgi:hypothetical protein
MIKVTTTHNKPKSFAWSYSRLKNFETCPARYKAIDVDKKFKEAEEGEALLWGNAVHKALAESISKGIPLPEGMKDYEKWVERTLANTEATTLVEQQLAITKEFGKTTWFGDDVWFRGIGDVIQIMGDVGLIVDWKTGKVLDDGSQLALMAACVFAHYPKVQAVRSEFIWLKHDATTRADIHRNDMPKVWKQLFPRIDALAAAHSTNEFPAKPGGLCRKWCVVRNCEHYGVG